MAILVSPRLVPSLSVSFSFSQRSRIRRSFSLSSICCSSSSVKMGGNPSGAAATAVLWYKKDLRVDDHPGLVSAASNHRKVIPLYVFDHRILRYFTDEMLELLLFALEDLRKSLKELGSDLVIRFGRAECVIQDLVKEVSATSIYTEDEVEYSLRMVMDVVKETLAMETFEEGRLNIFLWTTPFYDIKNMKDLPTSYEDFERLKSPVRESLLPLRLSQLQMEMDLGSLPTLDDLKKFMNDNPHKLKDNWSSIKNTSAEDVMRKNRIMISNSMANGLGLLKLGKSNQSNISSAHTRQKKLQNSAFVTRAGNLIGGGTNDVLNALAAYMRYFEGTSRDDWQEVHAKLRSAETREGSSFGALFRPALELGIISRRRVYNEAIKYEKERNGGFISPFGYSATTVAAAADHVCSMEWYRLLATRSQLDYTQKYPTRFWRWNGYLIQYAVAGHEGPPVLLVHGFGAFLEHFRGNTNALAKCGNRVWAITLLGFGRSEKPNVVHTELMWAELLRDFIIDIVGEPVHLVGNSFGGYFVSIVAGFWPALARSVVLLNSAGDVVPGYASAPSSKDRRTSGIAWLGARFLELYLRWSLRSLVRSCYPTKTDRADEGLLNEMIRASYDPGAMVVLESIFTFDPSIPLNYLLKGQEGKVLIIQGMKDPIADSKSKLAVVREHCKGIAIKELDAGHCPHDEVPEEVNSIIREWIVCIENGSVSSNTNRRENEGKKTPA